MGAAQRELARNDGELFLVPGYVLVPHVDWRRRHHDTVLPKGVLRSYKRDDWLWCLGKISASTSEDKVHLVRFLNDPGLI